MMEYKVAFHISYYCPWVYENKILKNGKKSKATRADGKIHYCGHTLAEAVEKFLSRGLSQNSRCTSMYISRGRERGKNIKWEDYQAGKYKAPQ